MSNGLTKTEIKEIINDEFEKKFNQMFTDALIKELKESSGKARKEITDIIKNAVLSVYKFMWLRRDTWQNEIK